MLANWLDNPIFVKHVRSRLRRQPTMAAVSLMYVTCLCILFAGFQLGFLYSGGYFATIFLVQCIVLVGVGAARISESVVKSRTSGILAFHRLSPLTPTELTLGFFFGPPVREYLLAVCTCRSPCSAWPLKSRAFLGSSR